MHTGEIPIGNGSYFCALRLIERDMAERNRLLRLKVSLPDKPGSLHSMTDMTAKEHGNLISVVPDRSFSQLPGNVDISFLIEVRNKDHQERILSHLGAAGFDAVIVSACRVCSQTWTRLLTRHLHGQRP